MSDTVETSAAGRGGLNGMLDKAEAVYLKVLRAIILLVATIMILYSAWLALAGLYKVSRSPESVKEQAATVAADEIVSITFAKPENGQATNKAKANKQGAQGEKKLYADFVKKHFALFKEKFEPYRRKDDKRLTQKEFEEEFLLLSARLEAVAEGDLNYEQDLQRLDGMFEVIAEAASRPETIKQLELYRDAKMMEVTRQEERTRTEIRREWDRHSMACRDWFYEPRGCEVRRQVEVPYTVSVTSMALPEGVISHTEIFRDFQEQYFSLLKQRKEVNAEKAEAERMRIIEGQSEGSKALFNALQVFAAFLLLMFFFLLIAIERHQRRISSASEPQHLA